MGCGYGLPKTFKQKETQLSGLFLKGHIGQIKVNWLIDTGARKNILSYASYDKLPDSQKFTLYDKGNNHLYQMEEL